MILIQPKASITTVVAAVAAAVLVTAVLTAAAVLTIAALAALATAATAATAATRTTSILRGEVSVSKKEMVIAFMNGYPLNGMHCKCPL